MGFEEPLAQKSESRPGAGPGEGLGVNLFDVYREQVSRFGAVDAERAGEGMGVGHDFVQFGNCGIGFDLPICRIQCVEFHPPPGFQFRHRLNIGMPTVVAFIGLLGQGFVAIQSDSERHCTSSCFGVSSVSEKIMKRVRCRGVVLAETPFPPLPWNGSASARQPVLFHLAFDRPSPRREKNSAVIYNPASFVLP